MIECIFTIDYEINGNGVGSLRELVYEPAMRLMTIFEKWDALFVLFVEVAELEKFDEYHVNDSFDNVRTQIREFHNVGIEIGLHLHPQWANAHYEDGRWYLDYSEYNLCALPRMRVEQIVRRSVAYLREILNVSDFTPLSFRAGGWLLQPTKTVAEVLAVAGIRVDSSVYKGGLQRSYSLDYRPALKNGYHWRFRNDVNINDRDGLLIEIPTYTEMVPFWEMITRKRMSLKLKSSLKSGGVVRGSVRRKTNCLLDFLRFSYPLKFDYCRMTSDQLIAMVGNVINEDKKDPKTYRPLVAIGHTKDLIDLDTVEFLLYYLKTKNIEIVTFRDVYSRISGQSKVLSE